LTLYDAQGHALDSINFNGNYQLANFTVEDDGSGNTLIVDPPVTTPTSTNTTPTNTTLASNQNSTDTAPTDGFAFNFGHHHHPSNDLNPGQDLLQPNGPMLTSLPTGATPVQGPINMPVAGDTHDQAGVSAFVKAHLNAHDFHFV
jgi:hypothetical protein